MKLSGIHHIAIICSDYERSKKFYTEVLGLQVIQEIYRKERESYKLDLALNEEYIIDLSEYFVSPNNTTLSYSLCNSPDITSSNKIIGSNLHILPDLRGETYSLYPYSKDTYYDKMDSNQTISINITELYTISQKEIFPIVSNIIETYDENRKIY